MVSARCIMAVKEELKNLGLHFVVVDLGEIEIMEEITDDERGRLKMGLLKSGLELMDDKKGMLMSKIKRIIFDMIHDGNGMIKISLSDVLSEKLEHDYTSMANLFSEVQGITIGQYFITQKVERVKELIVFDKMNMTEIAWQMNYSSVAHLSNQFKKVTGLTPSHYKDLKNTSLTFLATDNDNNEHT